jgi:exosortase/archaeosortase family protein
MDKKRPFKTILAALAIIMMLLPVLAAFNSVLTHWLDRAGWYRPIQMYLVPWEARMVAVAIKPFGVFSRVTPGNSLSAFYMIKDGAAIPVDLSWNCLGWQSLLFLMISLVAGLRGNFSLVSRFKTVFFGLLGTVLINVLRMAIIALGIYYVNSLAAQIVHDYFAAFLTLIWLFGFWYFAYSFVLEERTDDRREKTERVDDEVVDNARMQKG